MMTDIRPDTTLPTVWYDYIAQCWIKNGVVQPCGHPASMPSCCYAGEHAGERCDPAHFNDDRHGDRVFTLNPTFDTGAHAEADPRD